MKKTVMSVILLVATGLPVAYGQAGQTPPVAMKKENPVSIIKVFDKLSKSSKIPFLYSSTDFKDIKVMKMLLIIHLWNHRLDISKNSIR